MCKEDVLTEGGVNLRRAGEKPDGKHQFVEWVAEAHGSAFARLRGAVVVPPARRARIGVQEWHPAEAPHGRVAIRLLIDHLFRTQRVHSITLDALDTEVSLLTCALQCGFREGGRRRHVAVVDGHWRDWAGTGILEEEWRRGNSPEDVAFVPHRPAPLADHLPPIPEPSASDFAVLRGERITMRRKRPEDKETYFRWLCRPEWWRGWMPENPSGYQAPTREEFEAKWSGAPAPNDWIVETERGVPIGWCFYCDFDRANRVAEGGFLLYDADYWGKGYGTEAFGVLLRHVFEDLHLHRVRSATWAGNIGSLAVQLKNGLRIEVHGRDSYFVDGRWYDTYGTGILEDEWCDRP